MLKPSLVIITSLPLLTTLSLVMPSSVQALTLIESRADLRASDIVDWSSLGAIFNPFLGQNEFVDCDPMVLPDCAFATTSERGLGVDLFVPAPGPAITLPLVFLTDVPPFGIPAPYFIGDFVLATGLDPTQFPAPGNPGPLSITFEEPVAGAGANIGVDDTAEFTVFLTAYDAADQLLGTVSLFRDDQTEAFGTAFFLGIRSETENIQRIEFTSSEPNRAIGINALSIATIPEPGLLLGLGFLGLGLAKRRRSQSSSIFPG